MLPLVQAVSVSDPARGSIPGHGIKYGYMPLPRVLLADDHAILLGAFEKLLAA